MKKLLFSLISLFSIASYGQEKVYNFDKKISYKINTPDEYNQYLDGKESISLVNYITKDALLGIVEGFGEFGKSFNRESFFVNNNKFFDVYTNSLDNKLSIKIPYFYEGTPEEDLQPYKNDLFDSFVSIKKLSSSQTINGFKCNEYELTSNSLQNEEKKSTLCIDENNSINNVSFMFPQAKIKGLLVRFDAGDFNGLTIQNVSNSSAKISFDEKKEIDFFTKELSKRKEEYKKLYADNVAVDTVAASDYYSPDNRYDDPINSYYNYQTSENTNVNNLFNNIALLNYGLVYGDSDYDGTPDYDRSKSLKTAEASTNQILKQFKKNKLISKEELAELNKLFKKYFDDANKFELKTNLNVANSTEDIDSAAAATYNLAEYYEPYQSTYKTIDTGIIDLAIDNPDVSDFLKIAPEHCKNLKNNIPTFSDKSLAKEVNNYVGQICDLYIYNSGSVGLTETINSLRKSNLEIYNKYDQLSKEDKSKLNNFLNSLD
ncbi:hypothetical protein [Chishuiella sp.]|uniref:hypothetical protein n=1 Tax=Chishuiella sp. TaxID=1969467 RepID=UPI0028A7AE85|nr:hypothetical protein [Chishuiella sp.]